MYVLHPVEKKLFRSWRKERVFKRKETAAAIFASSVEPAGRNIVDESLVPPDESLGVDVAEEDNLKPRTVSFEEGEDDMAHTTIVSNYFKFKELGQTQSRPFKSKPNSAQPEDGMLKSCMHASGGSQEKYTDYFCKPHSVGDKKGSPLPDLANRIQIRHLFLFLPRKKKFSHHNRIWRLLRDLLSLKDSGWGPPPAYQE
jgi:hypothetical protein